MISIKIYNSKCRLVGAVDSETAKVIDKECSYIHQSFSYMQSKRASYGGWDGVVRLLNSSSFPVGLLSRVEGILKNRNVKYEKEDLRDKIEYGKKLEVDPNCFFKPRIYQVEAVKQCVKHGLGVVKMPTGSGKTGTLSMLTAEFNVKTMIYVIGVELLYQMKSTLETLYPTLEVGIIGDGICEIKDVNIATIWSAAAAFNKKIEVLDSDLTYDKDSNSKINKEKVRKAVREAEMFILDECQYAAASTVQFLHKESVSAVHRFLFSASPWRDGGDDLLIEAVGGQKIYELNASRLITDGFLVQPEIHFLSVPPIRGVGTNYQDVYKRYIVENEDRNNLIMSSAKKLLAAGRKVLILVTRVGHGKILMDLAKEEGLDCDFLDGNKSSKDRMGVIKKMKDGHLNLLIASKIFDQGVDIPELDALILAGSGKSSGRALQRLGRVIRLFPGKEKAIVVEFDDNAKYLKDHSDARYNVYKTEPMFKIKRTGKDRSREYKARTPTKWI